MTYIRNPDGDLFYDQNTNTYIPAGYNVLSISKSAFLKGGYLNPNITSVDMNNVPFTNNTAYSTFYSSGNSNLTSVTNINDSTTNMSHTFTNCHKLVQIDKFPNNVINIESCFYNCTNLIYAPNIPNSVTTMIDTFRNCTNLGSIPNMPDSVIYASGAYRDTINLITPPVLSNNLNPTAGLVLTFYGSGIATLPTIPDSVTNLTFTFANCNNLVNCFYSPLPNTIVNMKDTFANCMRLVNSPVLPNSVVNLSGTYNNCVNLTNSPSIPDSVVNMAGTFSNCYNLVTAPILPDGLETLGTENGVYGTGCFSNTALSTPPVIPNTVVNMSGCFSDCRYLTNMPTIPSSVTDMGACFLNCSNMIYAKAILNGVTNMADCFYNCTWLKTAPIIPRSVTRITGNVRPNHGLFSSCVNLKGNVYIVSNSIGNAMYTFENTSLPKNVYIPFTYTNNDYTITYNAFVNAGYDQQGTKDGVTLLDIGDKKIVTVISSKTTSYISLESENVTFDGYGSVSACVNNGSNIHYSIISEGLPFEEDTINNITEDIVITSSPEYIEKTYSVTYDDARFATIDLYDVNAIGLTKTLDSTEPVNLSTEIVITEQSEEE